MKLQSIYVVVAKAIVIILMLCAIVGFTMVIVGCNSQKEVTPTPVPLIPYGTAIQGTWEGINSKNIEHGIRFSFKPNCKVYLSVKQDDKYIDIAADGTYEIYDDKILHMTWSIRPSEDVLVSDEFWYITITGNVMFLSTKRFSKDGESYVITLTMKKIN